MLGGFTIAHDSSSASSSFKGRTRQYTFVRQELKVMYGSILRRLLQLVLCFEYVSSSAFENAYWPWSDHKHFPLNFWMSLVRILSVIYVLENAELGDWEGGASSIATALIDVCIVYYV